MQVHEDVAHEEQCDHGDGDDDADRRSRASARGAVLDDDLAAHIFVVFVLWRLHAQRGTASEVPRRVMKGAVRMNSGKARLEIPAAARKPVLSP